MEKLKAAGAITALLVIVPLILLIGLFPLVLLWAWAAGKVSFELVALVYLMFIVYSTA